MQKRIKVSSFNNTVKTVVAGETEREVKVGWKKIDQSQILFTGAPTLGRVTVGQGLSFDSTYGVIGIQDNTSITSAPVICKEYVEKEAFDQLKMQCDLMMGQISMLEMARQRFEMLESISGGSYVLQEKINKIRNLETELLNTQRKLEWDGNSVINQLREVRGDQYRQIY